MKKLFTLLAIVGLSLTAQAQDITNTLGSGGKFLVQNNTGATTLLSIDDATGKIGMNNAIPNSTLSVTGSLSLSYNAGGNITLNDTHYSYFADNNATVTLPNAGSCSGRIYIIKALGSGGATVNATSGDTIDGAGSTSLLQYKYVMVQSGGGTNWWIIGQN